ncbi:hypothetical protein AB838_03140 [Rhodobacteraceae bacterium (ex Bugula neritina AB1)]|nr:hypothetical protein AB838_03140 [Rhodobacteraceae bacterium (ex Bugula neritina AB1)]
MLVLQVSFAGAGQVAADGEWIEICGEYGAVEIQVDSEQDGRVQDCPECTACPMCTAESAARSAGVLFLGPNRMAECNVLLPPGAAVQPNPAQYWNDGRGPPLVNKKHSEHTPGAPVAATQIEGEAPWI